MRVPERRLRRLEDGLLPPAETEELRRLHEIPLDLRRRQAALGLPEMDDGPEPHIGPTCHWPTSYAQGGADKAAQ
jgi:hypothetical protein